MDRRLRRSKPSTKGCCLMLRDRPAADPVADHGTQRRSGRFLSLVRMAMLLVLVEMRGQAKRRHPLGMTTQTKNETSRPYRPGGWGRRPRPNADGVGAG